HEEKFSSSSYEELLKKFRIHPSRLNTLLDMLLRQKKIVKSQEGFLLHAEWLEELKQKLADLKRQGQKELTVGDFKKLTGLTRKYAIPLLEFLDELGLTSRVGNKRIIL
ncbi:MAG: SelB C-terminal domain-containing protein, partial [Candidatus Saccharicenans sp.]